MTESKLNMYKNDHTRESGQIKPTKINRKDDRKIKDTNNEITDVDNAAHQTRQDNIYAQRKRQKAEIVKEGDTMRKCAVSRKKFNTLKKQLHQQKKTTGTTTKSNEKTITNKRRISLMQHYWSTIYQ